MEAAAPPEPAVGWESGWRRRHESGPGGQQRSPRRRHRQTGGYGPCHGCRSREGEKGGTYPRRHATPVGMVTPHPAIFFGVPPRADGSSVRPPCGLFCRCVPTGLRGTSHGDRCMLGMHPAGPPVASPRGGHPSAPRRRRAVSPDTAAADTAKGGPCTQRRAPKRQHAKPPHLASGTPYSPRCGGLPASSDQPARDDGRDAEGGVG